MYVVTNISEVLDGVRSRMYFGNAYYSVQSSNDPVYFGNAYYSVQSSNDPVYCPIF
jgi:hypothetical protein